MLVQTKLHAICKSHNYVFNDVSGNEYLIFSQNIFEAVTKFRHSVSEMGMWI